MIVVYQILNALVCGGMACLDADKIYKGKKINHLLNGVIHILVSLGALFFFDWKIALAVLLQSRVVFDVALNLFRELPVDYVPLKPVSLIDQLEKKIFGNNGILPKVIYLVISVILNFI